MSIRADALPPFSLPSRFGAKLFDLGAAVPLIAGNALSIAQQGPALLDFVVKADLETMDALFITVAMTKLVSLALVSLLFVLLIIRRVPRMRAHGVVPRLIAIGGTYLGILIVACPETRMPRPLLILSAALILFGTGFALYAVLRLGRSISMLPEARRLVTDGPYARIRHPLYLGEAIAMVGLTLEHASAWTMAVLALQFAFQFQRMANEECLLRRAFPDYASYIARTWRLVPGLY